MKNFLTKLRYTLWGKQIQKALLMAEDAGREAAKYPLEIEIRELQHKHKNEINYLAEDLANKKIQDLGYGFNPDDVMTTSKNPDGTVRLVYLGGEQLGGQEVRNLQQEVKFLRSSKIWPIITDTLKSQAHDLIVNKSQTFEDMRSGKMMVFNLSVQDNILKSIEKIAVTKNM